MAGAVLAPAESLLLGALSQSTGSVVIDAAAGGVISYALAPRSAKPGYAIGGAVATGLFGVLGLATTLAVMWATSKDKPKRRSKARR